MNIKLRSLFGILTLAGLFCVPMSFPDGLRFYLLFGPSLLVTLSVMSVFTWRSKSRSIVKSFILGTFCMLIPSSIWPIGYYFYMAMTNGFFRSAVGGNVYLKFSVSLLVVSVFGGLIGIALAIVFSKTRRAMAPPPSDNLSSSA